MFILRDHNLINISTTHSVQRSSLELGHDFLAFWPIRVIVIFGDRYKRVPCTSIFWLHVILWFSDTFLESPKSPTHPLCSVHSLVSHELLKGRRSLDDFLREAWNGHVALWQEDLSSLLTVLTPLTADRIGKFPYLADCLGPLQPLRSNAAVREDQATKGQEEGHQEAPSGLWGTFFHHHHFCRLFLHCRSTLAEAPRSWPLLGRLLHLRERLGRSQVRSQLCQPTVPLRVRYRQDLRHRVLWWWRELVHPSLPDQLYCDNIFIYTCMTGVSLWRRGFLEKSWNLMEFCVILGTRKICNSWCIEQCCTECKTIPSYAQSGTDSSERGWRHQAWKRSGRTKPYIELSCHPDLWAVTSLKRPSSVAVKTLNHLTKRLPILFHPVCVMDAYLWIECLKIPPRLCEQSSMVQTVRFQSWLDTFRHGLCYVQNLGHHHWLASFSSQPSAEDSSLIAAALPWDFLSLH